MAEITIEKIEQIALTQFQERGHVDPLILDLIIADRQIDLDSFKNKKKARELWHNLIIVSLVSPTAYENFCDDIEARLERLKDGGIPDIPA